MFWMAAAGSAAMAQAPGQQLTGPNWGLGRGGGALNDKNVPPPTVRSVQGTVLDAKGQAIKGATVFLKNDRTAKVQSVTVDSTGSYRFAQVSRNDDYKLWATFADKKTPEKVISSFDPKVEVNRELKID
jgi:hypothetical protein